MKQAELKKGVNPQSPVFTRTAALYSYKNDDDVTRVVATDHVRNKQPLRESTSLQLSHTTCTSISTKSTLSRM